MEIEINHSGKLFLRPHELSEALSISLSTLWRWRRSGIVPEPIPLGPRVVGWRMTDINNWLENR